MSNNYQGQESRVREESMTLLWQFLEESQYIVFITVRKIIDNVSVYSIYLQN